MNILQEAKVIYKCYQMGPNLPSQLLKVFPWQEMIPRTNHHIHDIHGTVKLFNLTPVSNTFGGDVLK